MTADSQDDDPLQAAIDEKLAAIANNSPTPPDWYEAWKRLGPESSDDERLAVYWAIRDSGCLSDEAGFYLVAWQIGEMASREADTSLRGLDDRLEAIQRDYELETGRSWPPPELPPEYEDLSRQHDAAWDQIFLAKLDALGEQETAALYRSDPDLFRRGCDAGLKYFETPINVRKPLAPDALVQLTSCLDPPHASFVHNALARAGIQALDGNAAFISWYWYYSNATGGVPIYVRNKDVQAARKALAAATARPSESLPPWSCPSCGERIAGEWEVCWRCGHMADGTLAAPPIHETAGSESKEETADEADYLVPFAVLTAGLMAATLLTFGLLATVLFVPIVALLAFLMLRRRVPLSSTPEPPGAAEPGDLPAEDASRTRSEATRAMVQRAWRAAIFTIGFPLLVPFSLWALWRVARRRRPLGRTDKWRVWAAVCVDVAVLLPGLVVVVLLLIGLVSALCGWP